MNVGKSLEKAIKINRITQAKLAKDLKVTASYINWVVHNRVGVSTEKLNQFANYFGMSVSGFIALGEEPTPDTLKLYTEDAGVITVSVSYEVGSGNGKGAYHA